MLTKRIIACLDVNAGRVVKGVQFVDLVDAGIPRKSPLATPLPEPTKSSSSTSRRPTKPAAR